MLKARGVKGMGKLTVSLGLQILGMGLLLQAPISAQADETPTFKIQFTREYMLDLFNKIPGKVGVSPYFIVNLRDPMKLDPKDRPLSAVPSLYVRSKNPKDPDSTRSVVLDLKGALGLPDSRFAQLAFACSSSTQLQPALDGISTVCARITGVRVCIDISTGLRDSSDQAAKDLVAGDKTFVVFSAADWNRLKKTTLASEKVGHSSLNLNFADNKNKGPKAVQLLPIKLGTAELVSNNEKLRAVPGEVSGPLIAKALEGYDKMSFKMKGELLASLGVSVDGMLATAEARAKFDEALKEWLPVALEKSVENILCAQDNPREEQLKIHAASNNSHGRESGHSQKEE
jgi:hypothetical protein